MNNAIKMLVASLAASQLSGCGTPRAVLSYDALMPQGNEAIVVFGMSQPNVKMGVTEAIVGEGLTQPISMWQGWIGGKPLNNYLVMKVKGDTYYQLTPYIFYVGEEVVRSYWPCNAAKTIAFKAEPGKVTYVADVRFFATSGEFKIQPTKNFLDAKKNIDDNYPNLRGNAVDGNFDVVTAAKKCLEESSADIYYFIDIPARGGGVPTLTPWTPPIKY